MHHAAAARATGFTVPARTGRRASAMCSRVFALPIRKPTALMAGGTLRRGAEPPNQQTPQLPQAVQSGTPSGGAATDDAEDGFLEEDATWDGVEGSGDGSDSDGLYIDDEGGDVEELEAADADEDLLRVDADDSEGSVAAGAVETEGTNWAEAALAAARRILAGPGLQHLELYAFRALPGGRLDIRLDDLEDTYGSPSIQDIEAFSRLLLVELSEELGPAVSDQIELEVSSPGAERTLRLPQDLERFAGLPLAVEYSTPEAGEAARKVMVLEALDTAAGLTTWRLADVRANAPAKGRKLSKRQLTMQISIPLANIKTARVHVDF